jgi:hypothetical protein
MDWVNPAPGPAELEPLLQGLVPCGKADAGADFAPDVDVVEHRPAGGPAGLLVCRVGPADSNGPTGAALLEGDVIVCAGGRPLLLPDWPEQGPGGGDDEALSEKELAGSAAWRALGEADAKKLFEKMDGAKQGRLDAGAFRRRAEAVLAGGLLGPRKATVTLQVCPPHGPRAIAASPRAAAAPLTSRGRSGGLRPGAAGRRWRSRRLGPRTAGRRRGRRRRRGAAARGWGVAGPNRMRDDVDGKAGEGR